MRIAQLANFYGAESGGLHTCLDELGRGYAAAGHERLLVTPGARTTDRAEGRNRHVEVEGRRLPGLDPYLVVTDIKAVQDLLDDWRPDVIEVSDKLTLHRLADWARPRRVGTVLVSHERLDAHLRPRVPGWFPLTRVADAVNGRLLDRFDAIVAASAFAADEFTRLGATNVVRVPLGVDLETFHPPHGGGGSGAHPPTVNWLGRMSKEKRPELAVETLRVLVHRGVDVRMVLVGDGPMRATLERAAAGLPATFAGHVGDRRRLAELLGQADVALNVCPAETFGLSILEAMACGTPAVAPNVGAAPELFASGAGVATYLHPDAFASAVTEVLSWPERPRRRAARRRAEDFPWASTVRAMLALHARVAPRRTLAV